jgi:hypothetical protein
VVGLGYGLGMGVEKMSISVDGPLGAAIRAAAQEAGQPVSTWVAQAAQARLRSVALARFLDEWQAENGAFTAAEIAAAEVELGYRKHASGVA